MPLHQSYQRSDQGDGRFNEDCYGVNTHCAWLLDGATGLDQLEVDGVSAAYWFVETFSQTLDTLSTDGTKRTSIDLLKQTLERVTIKFERKVPRELKALTPPSSTLIMVHDRSDHIELTALGDSRAIYSSNTTGPNVFGSSPIEALDDTVLKKLRYIRQTHPDCSLDEARKELMSDLTTIRGRMNQPNGYWVLSPAGTPLNHALALKLSKQDLADGQLLLATDGFLRLPELFMHCDHQNLLSMTNQQLDESFQVLREIESRDPDAKRYPRLKQHDDATCIRIDVS